MKVPLKPIIVNKLLARTIHVTDTSVNIPVLEQI